MSPNPLTSRESFISTSSRLSDLDDMGSDSDQTTAVNSPFVRTPRESQPDLARIAGPHVPDSDHVSRALERQRNGRPDHIRSPLSASSSVAFDLQEKEGGLHGVKRDNERATEDEMAIRRDVRRSGSIAHTDVDVESASSPTADAEKRAPSVDQGNGVLERKELVHLGDGPEEIVIIDWLPDDPKVSIIELRSV